MSEAALFLVFIASYVFAFALGRKHGRESMLAHSEIEHAVDRGVEIGRKVERWAEERYRQPPAWWIEQMAECREAHLPGDCPLCGAR